MMCRLTSYLLALGLLVLLSACVQPSPQAYIPPYTPPPEPYSPPPNTAFRPLPLLAPAPPPAPEPIVAPEPLAPLLPAAPTDPIEIPPAAFFPVDTGPAPEPAPAATAPRLAPAEPSTAVPFMGFRPMKGQTKALP